MGMSKLVQITGHRKAFEILEKIKQEKSCTIRVIFKKADEFVSILSIIKIQKIEEYAHFC